MKLNQFCPYDIFASPEQGLQAFLRTILVRTNFVPGIRHVIGWRGLKESFVRVQPFPTRKPARILTALRQTIKSLSWSGGLSSVQWICGTDCRLDQYITRPVTMFC